MKALSLAAGLAVGIVHELRLPLLLIAGFFVGKYVR